MTRIGLSMLLVFMFFYYAFSEDDESNVLFCYRHYLQCNTMESFNLSPFVPGKVFPVYTKKLINDGCRYLKAKVNCHYNTSRIRGCTKYYNPSDFYIALADTYVQRACKGDLRKDVDSFLGCMNNMNIQADFLIAFHYMRGYITASKKLGINDAIMDNICSELTGEINSLMYNIGKECGNEDKGRFHRYLQLFRDYQQVFFSFITGSTNRTDCSFLG